MRAWPSTASDQLPIRCSSRDLHVQPGPGLPAWHSHRAVPRPARSAWRHLVLTVPPGCPETSNQAPWATEAKPVTPPAPPSRGTRHQLANAGQLLPLVTASSLAQSSRVGVHALPLPCSASARDRHLHSSAPDLKCVWGCRTKMGRMQSHSVGLPKFSIGAPGLVYPALQSAVSAGPDELAHRARTLPVA